MARGYPDYANPVYSIAARNIDFNLLAAVQMGITPIDGRGRIYWFDNFLDGANGWILGFAGGSALPYLSVDRTIGRGISLAMPTGATPTTDYSQAAHLQAFAQENRFGVEVGFAAGGNRAYLETSLVFHQSGQALDFRFRCYLESGDLDIWDGAAWINVGSLGAQVIQYSWSQVKMVCDPITGYYVRLMAGMSEIDISAYPGPVVAVTYQQLLVVGLRMRSNNAGALTGYVSHVILSTDEP